MQHSIDEKFMNVWHKMLHSINSNRPYYVRDVGTNGPTEHFDFCLIIIRNKGKFQLKVVLLWPTIKGVSVVEFHDGALSISMTSLLMHTVAHSTRPSFRSKTNNQPTKKFLSLEVTWVKGVKMGQILTFKVNFLCQKWSESFWKKF